VTYVPRSHSDDGDDRSRALCAVPGDGEGGQCDVDRAWSSRSIGPTGGWPSSRMTRVRPDRSRRRMPRPPRAVHRQAHGLVDDELIPVQEGR